jgi:hypothetical protein
VEYAKDLDMPATLYWSTRPQISQRLLAER